MHKTQAQVDQRPQHKTTLNLIEEKVGNSFECIGTEDDFLNRTSRSTTNQWNLKKVKGFYKAKGSTKRTKQWPIEW